MAETPMRSLQAGFTLIEALVALAIVALVSAGSFTAIQGFADQQYRLQTRIESESIAWNRLLLEYQSNRGWLPPSAGAPELAGRAGEWSWKVDSEPTLTGFLVRHRIEVRRESGNGSGTTLMLYLPLER